jgi:carbon starvation protein
VYEPLRRPDWLPGSMFASAVITGGWGYLIWSGSIDTIWPMFGVANQALSVLALALVTTWLVNNGNAKYAWVTALPMLFVASTTFTAGTNLVLYRFPAMANQTAAVLNVVMTLCVLASVATVLLMAMVRWAAVLTRK